MCYKFKIVFVPLPSTYPRFVFCSLLWLLLLWMIPLVSAFRIWNKRAESLYSTLYVAFSSHQDEDWARLLNSYSKRLDCWRICRYFRLYLVVTIESICCFGWITKCRCSLQQCESNAESNELLLKREKWTLHNNERTFFEFVPMSIHSQYIEYFGEWIRFLPTLAIIGGLVLVMAPNIKYANSKFQCVI